MDSNIWLSTDAFFYAMGIDKNLAFIVVFLICLLILGAFFAISISSGGLGPRSKRKSTIPDDFDAILPDNVYGRPTVTPLDAAIAALDDELEHASLPDANCLFATHEVKEAFDEWFESEGALMLAGGCSVETIARAAWFVSSHQNNNDDEAFPDLSSENYPKVCSTCLHWQVGQCSDPDASYSEDGSLPDNGWVGTDEFSGIRTGPLFGCVRHTRLKRNVIMTGVAPTELCHWVFKSVECGYQGSEHSYCDKTIKDCEARFCANNFGGFPKVRK